MSDESNRSRWCFLVRYIPALVILVGGIILVALILAGDEGEDANDIAMCDCAGCSPGSIR